MDEDVDVADDGEEDACVCAGGKPHLKDRSLKEENGFEQRTGYMGNMGMPPNAVPAPAPAPALAPV